MMKNHTLKWLSLGPCPQDERSQQQPAEGRAQFNESIWESHPSPSRRLPPPQTHHEFNLGHLFIRILRYNLLLLTVKQ